MTLPKNIVMIHFDDGCKSVVKYGYPVLSIYDLKGSVFPIGRSIGTPERMSVLDLQFLQEQGWSICNHTFSHRSMTDVSLGVMRSDLVFAAAFYKSHGLRGYKFLAYPRGAYDSRVLNIVRKHCLLARTTRGGIGDDEVSRHTLPSLGVDDYDRYTKHMEYLTSGTIVTLLFHSVGFRNRRATNISVSDLMRLCKNLYKRRKKGELEVLTIEEYYDIVVKGNHEAEYHHIK